MVFIFYFVVLVGLGFYAGRRQAQTSEDYFLAGRRLPWYVVGTSFIASNISTEHFIGMIGSAYVFGVCVASWLREGPMVTRRATGPSGPWEWAFFWTSQ